MEKRGELYSWERDEAYRFMVNSFNRDIGGQMDMNVINTIISHMKSITTIDPNMGGILAAIDMTRK